MLNDLDPSSFDNVYLATGYTDIRKGIDGLVVMIQENFQLDPFSKSIFLFCGRRPDRIKAVCYEGDGFLLCYKRLASGKFQWPRTDAEARNLSKEQFQCLMKGWAIDPSIHEFKPRVI